MLKRYENSNRNCGVELLRFLFAMVIVLGHSYGSFKQKNLPSYIIKQGPIGVEFFFILSGILLAKSCAKKSGQMSSAHEIGESTFEFVKKKYLMLFPTHLMAFVILFIEYIIVNSVGLRDTVRIAIHSLPELLLVQMGGLRIKTVNMNDWYLSAMLLAMLIIYPLAIKLRSMFSKCVGPLIALFALGYCYLKTEGLTPSTELVFEGGMLKGMLRAIAEIAIGVTVYEAIKWFDGLRLNRIGVFAARIVELGCYATTIIMTTTNEKKSWYFSFIFVLAVGLMITFSQWSIFSIIKHSKIILYLGDLSMTIFLCQRIVLLPLEHYLFFGKSYYINTFVFVSGTIVLSVILKMIIDIIVDKKPLEVFVEK